MFVDSMDASCLFIVLVLIFFFFFFFFSSRRRHTRCGRDWSSDVCSSDLFMSRPPVEYAEMLRRRLEEHGTRVWLLNTGWTGGGYDVGSRIKLQYTRALVRAALHGVLDDIATETDPVFGLAVPVRAPGVPSEVLRPRDTWADPAGYDAAARKLAGMFRENFRRFESALPAGVVAAGPRT